MSDRRLWFWKNADAANALADLIEAAERGDGAAACRLGDIYREEVVGLDGSSKSAFHYYSRSALAGDAWGAEQPRRLLRARARLRAELRQGGEVVPTRGATRQP